MLREHRYKNLIWVNLEDPTKNEAIRVMEEFNLPPTIAETFLSRVPYSKMDSFGNFQSVVLHFPLQTSKGSSIEQEVDFVVGRDFLITVHHGPSTAIFEAESTFDTMAVLDTIDYEDKAGLLFLYVVERIYHHILDELGEIGTSLVRIEKTIFEGGQEESMIRALSILNRRIIDMRRSLKFHDTILRKIESSAAQTRLVSLSQARHTRDEFEHISKMIETHKEILEDLRHTAELLLSTRSNQVMRLISIIGFVFIPFSIAASILSSNILLPFEITPLTTLVTLASTAGLGIVLLIVFARKKWL